MFHARMATTTPPEASAPLLERLLEAVGDYKLVVAPLVAGLSLIVLGWALDYLSTAGGYDLYIEAGIAAATGIILVAITVVVYLVFWSLGRFGH